MFTFGLSILVLLYMMTMIRRAKQCGAHGLSAGKAAETGNRAKRQHSPQKNARGRRDSRRTGSTNSSESGLTLATESYAQYQIESTDPSPTSGLDHDYSDGQMSPPPQLAIVDNGYVPSIRVLAKRNY